MIKFFNVKSAKLWEDYWENSDRLYWPKAYTKQKTCDFISLRSGHLTKFYNIVNYTNELFGLICVYKDWYKSSSIPANISHIFECGR